MPFYFSVDVYHESWFMNQLNNRTYWDVHVCIKLRSATVKNAQASRNVIDGCSLSKAHIVRGPNVVTILRNRYFPIYLPIYESQQIFRDEMARESKYLSIEPKSWNRLRNAAMAAVSVESLSSLVIH